MKVSIRQCSRCGQDHENLEFEPFNNPADEWTHWAMCPTNAEPILLRIVPQS